MPNGIGQSHHSNLSGRHACFGVLFQLWACFKSDNIGLVRVCYYLLFTEFENENENEKTTHLSGYIRNVVEVHWA